MLHEILLSLSGHPSALFDAQPGHSHVTSTPIALLSPPEAELLSSLGHLSRLHRRTRDHVTRIAASHPSTVCRAVAAAITSYHLDKFQRQILDVESRILKQDASTVGAYNIVPLAGIVGEFSEWVRLMEWLWDISSFIMSPEVPKKAEQTDQRASSGAGLIDKLRTESQTGYPDLEEAALHLGTVAETSWLRQLSTWLLYGRLPSFGATDFFIGDDHDEDLSFAVNHKLLPKYVTRQTAASILFIGKSLNQIRSLPSSSSTLSGSSSTVSELELLPVHVRHLSEVTAPISSAKLSEAVANIRLSLSRNLLQHLLPRDKIVEILTVLHQFFLLGRGEFPMALIAEADERIHSRHRNPLQTKSSQGIQGILLKEAEINHTLARSFSVLSTLSGEDDHTDDILDVAMDILHLSVQDRASHRPGTPGRARDSAAILPQIAIVAFDDLLLAVPTSLTMDIRSPLDLFMTKADLDVYSAINAYLLALRRAHLHIVQLWRQSSIRRVHPGPPDYRYSNSPHGMAVLGRRRERNNTRTRYLRPVWATCAAAIFFLSESEAYFQGEVVQESFRHFLHWVEHPERDSSTTSTSTSTNLEPQPSSGSTRSQQSTITPEAQHHDPEALSLAHRHFLTSVTYSLLLTDPSFPRTLRTLFTHVDELVAYITRLQTIHQNLDLEEDEGFEDFSHNYKQEEKDVSLELDRARRRLDSDLKALMERLREIDSERVGTGGWEAIREYGSVEGRYEPLRVGGVDRLLMKLDWGGEDEEEENEDLI
ncbi:Spc98 family protein [Trematosphaeria pertusa]|uniref:Spindle pole body component n=1 Tax=Trematosphaeria pertusa TaxID=390896 RepID=A0A6A6IEX4_9PLEO|nr:Spc98 family protein [Trematosphaeria pertusa]KAF2248956.1 Spc98 family protein [Trematosphaeria pertusa]